MSDYNSYLTNCPLDQSNKLINYYVGWNRLDLSIYYTLPKSLNWEPVLPQILYYRVVERFGDARRSVQNPQVIVIWFTHYHIAVGFIQPHDPVVSINRWNRESYFEFSVGMLSISWIRNCSSNNLIYNTILVTCIDNSDGSIIVKRVVGKCVGTIRLSRCWNRCLLVPYSQITSKVDIRDSFGRINWYFESRHALDGEWWLEFESWELYS